MKECPQCKTMLEDDELFCHECGTKQEVDEVAVQDGETATPLEQKCIHCGEMIEADSAFCPFCGKPQIVDEKEDEKTVEPKPEPIEEKTDTHKEQEADSQFEEEQPQVENEQESVSVKDETTSVVTDKEPEPAKVEKESEPETIVEKKKSKAWLWILVLMLILAGIGGWYYFAQIDSYEKSEELTDEAIAEDFEQNEDEYVEPDYKDSDEKDGMTAFLDDFYMYYMNESYLKSHVTPAVLNKLRRDFPYDCDRGDCLGTWVFMTYPAGADMELEEGPTISKTEVEGRYKVDFKYSGYNGEQKNYYLNTVFLTITKLNDKYLISDYKVFYQDEAPMETVSNSAPPISEEIVMSGTVTKYKIHMILRFDGTKVTGLYYYDSQGRDNNVKLMGYIDGERMILNKYDKGQETGYFDGTFDGITYTGLDLNYHRSTELSFTVRINDGS